MSEERQRVQVACGVCPKEVVGRAVVVIPQVLDDDTETFIEDRDNGRILHPRCYDEMIQQVFAQEGTVILTVLIGTVDNIVTALYEGEGEDEE